jgi:cyclopropane-fatty-acyl-phospholipid synthase
MVVRWLLRRLVADLDVTVQLPDGTRVGAGRPGAPVMQIHHPAFFDRVGVDHKLGVGEGYLAGEWGPGPGTDLADLLAPFAERLTDIVPAGLRRFRRLVERRHPRHEDNDRAGARANIARHYDLSNELFATFLDETMTYSAAWFDQRTGTEGFEGLAQAQRRKVDGILDLAQVGPQTRLLEIGSGWGQLAIQAAGRGAWVDTITLSREQQTKALERVAEAGLSDRVRVMLRDYRDLGELGEVYDAVASVEMIEAVGERYWPDYFRAVASVLAPGGWFGLQAITMPHQRMLDSRHAYTWVHRYVFPGGLIPSREAIAEQAAAVGLTVLDERSLGADYAHTLRLWRERFLDQAAAVRELGFDELFTRVWEFYLAYSEAGFRSGHLDVWQLGLRHDGRGPS